MLSNFLDLGGVKNKSQGRSSWISLTTPERVRRQGRPCHAAAPLPLLSNLPVENNSEIAVLISRHSCGAAAPGPYRRRGCPVAPGRGKVSAGTGCASPFASLLLLLRVGLPAHRKPGRLLSTEFYLLPLLYGRISLEEQWEEGLLGRHMSIPSASTVGLCLSGAAALGEGATVYGIEQECRRGSGARGCRSGGNIASLLPGILFSLMKREWPLNVSPACLSVLSCTMG